MIECVGVVSIPIAQIRPNRAQPRSDFDTNAIIRLADSIRRYGIIQPLTVRECEEEGRGARYELIAGERRLRAAKMLELETVPCSIVEVDDRQSAEMAVIENILRENLNMFEQALAFERLIRVFSLTQEEVAKRLSISQSAVANKLRLLRFSDEERSCILAHALTERHARALLRVQDPLERANLIAQIAASGLNVSATEALIDQYLQMLSKNQQEEPDKPLNHNVRIGIRDIKIFYNSINRAVETMRAAGVGVVTERIERENEVHIAITIPKQA